MAHEPRDIVSEQKEYRQSLMDKLSVETSVVETWRPEDDKDAYIQKLEDKVDRLNTIVDEIAEKTKGLDKKSLSAIDQEIKNLKTYYQGSKLKLKELRAMSGDAAQEIKDSSTKAWKDFSEGIKKTISKL